MLWQEVNEYEPCPMRRRGTGLLADHHHLHMHNKYWDRVGITLTCCLQDVTQLCSLGRLLSRAASTKSSCLHLSSSSSKTPASVALRRSPMRTRSVPDHSEFTQPLRPAILEFGTH